MKSINQTSLFLMLTFTISWALVAIFYLLGGRYGTLGFAVLGMFYMFVPTLSVLIIKKLVHKEEIKKQFLISFKLNRWFIFAWLAMPLIMFVVLGITLLFPDVSYNPAMTGLLDRLATILTPDQITQSKIALAKLPISYLWIVLIQGMIAGITINALAAFGEELAWRGFLLRQFQYHKFYQASLIIGLIWGLWHAPMILMGHNYTQHPQLGVLMMTVMCLLLTPMLIYTTIKAKSVIAAAIMHGTMNAVAGISIIAISGGTDLTAGITGLAGFIALILCLGLIFIYDQYLSKDKIMSSVLAKNI